MKIEKRRLREILPENSAIVVIDVLRAFTTAAFAFGGGAKKILVTSTVKEAFDLHSRHPEAFLIGEENGKSIEQFHFDNSPAQVSSADLQNATLIHRTTCGTQGLLLSKQAKNVLAVSFAVAEATYRRILQLSPPHVTFLITGRDDADEDASLADYLELKLRGENPPLAPYLKRVEESELAKKFLSIPNPRLKEDLYLALQADRFSFSMELSNQNVLSPIFT